MPFDTSTTKLDLLKLVYYVQTAFACSGVSRPSYVCVWGERVGRVKVGE